MTWGPEGNKLGLLEDSLEVCHINGIGWPTWCDPTTTPHLQIYVVIGVWLTSQFVCPKWPWHTTIWHKYINICPWSNSLDPPHVYSQTSMQQCPKILWLTFFHNPYFYLDIQWKFTLGTNIHIKCVHFTYLWTILYIYIPFSFLPSRIDENDGMPCHLQIDGLWSTPVCIRSSSSKRTSLCQPQNSPQTWFPHHAEVQVVCSLHLTLMPVELNILLI